MAEPEPWALGAALAVNGVAHLASVARRRARPAGAEEGPDGAAAERTWLAFQRRYLCVYALATFGDWVQGAFLYAAYREYGLSMRQIALVFVVGYTVSATLGTYAASAGDRFGHKRCVVAYGALYAAGCVALWSPSWWALLLGRACSGVAYSLLYSSFESWAVADCDASGVDRARLDTLFANGTYCNGASAIVAGVVGQAILTRAREAVEAGAGAEVHAANMYLAPFEAAIASLLATSVVAWLTWEERRGGLHGSRTDTATVANAIRAVWSEPTLWSIGVMNSLYECALYVFVFMWTPVLERRHGTTPPHGVIFALFMCCKMAGSQLFLALSSAVTPPRMLNAVFALSILTFLAPIVLPSYEVALGAFCCFEFGLGLYWPAIASLRAHYVPDAMRASVASVFRIPLNLLVVVCLLEAGHVPEEWMLGCVCVLLAVCIACTHMLVRSSRAAQEGGGVTPSPRRDVTSPFAYSWSTQKDSLLK